MKESVAKRLEAVKLAETPEDLRKHLCPFFEKGGYSECVTCRKTEADVEECRDYYLDRIALIPLDLWDEEFDKFIVKERDTIPVEEVVGIGINCDSCYMYDKCPLYKKGYACGIKWDTNKPTTPAEFVDFMLSTQYERVRRSAVFEKIDGGVPDAGLSGELDRLHGLVAFKTDMNRERLSLSVEASGPALPQGGGILAKLFGGGGSTSSESKPIEISAPDTTKESEFVPFEEVKEPVKSPRKRKE